MRSFFIAIAALITVLGYSTHASAEHYVSGKLGGGFQTENTDNRDSSSIYGIEAGYDFGPIRTGLEYMRNDTGGAGGSNIGDVDLHTIGVNLYIEPWTLGKFTPYGKVGLAYGVADGAGITGAAGALGNVGAGVDYAVNKNWSLFTDYDYQHAMTKINVKTNRGSDERFEIHRVLVGARYSFN